MLWTTLPTRPTRPASAKRRPVRLDVCRQRRANARASERTAAPAVVDLLTTGQTFVNDEPVVFRALKDGDVITVGDARFKVRLVGSKVGEKPKAHGENGKGSLVRLAAEPVSADLVNIEQVEGAQRWRVAESLEKLEKAGRKS